MASKNEDREPAASPAAVADVLRWLVGRARHYSNWVDGSRRRSVAPKGMDPIMAAMFGRIDGLDDGRAAHVGTLLERLLQLHEDWFVVDTVAEVRGTALTRRDFYIWHLYRQLTRTFQLARTFQPKALPLEAWRRAFTESGVSYPDEVRVIVEAFVQPTQGTHTGSARERALELIIRLENVAPLFGRRESTIKNIHRFVFSKAPHLFAPKDLKAVPSGDPSIGPDTLVDALTASDIDDKSTDLEMLLYFATSVLRMDPGVVEKIRAAVAGSSLE
jgi:hypothetical protein